MRRLLFALVLFVIALPLIAQERHQVFKIEFRSRIPASILRSQSALSEDRTYTDEELQLALARLRRLPFVYNASYTIEGSTIIIEVVDEYHVYYQLDSLGQFTSGSEGGHGHVSAELGGRLYAPWGGVAQASYGLQSESGGRGNTYTAEYAQYGLAGSRLFVILQANKPSQSGSSTQPAFQIGYPLTLRQTIYARGFKSKFHDFENVGTSGSFSNADEEKTVAVGWRWDTTNDPFFATRGLFGEIERGATKTTGNALSIASNGRVVFASDRKTDSDVTNLSGKYFWPIGRGAFTAAAAYESDDGTQDFRLAPATTYTRTNLRNSHTRLTGGYVLNFFPLISQMRHSRHRIEAAVGIDNFRFTSGQHTSKSDYITGELGYAYRNRWGTFHLVLGYLGE
jgi:hypothetical protein